MGIELDEGRGRSRVIGVEGVPASVDVVVVVGADGVDAGGGRASEVRVGFVETVVDDDDFHVVPADGELGERGVAVPCEVDADVAEVVWGDEVTDVLFHHER